LPRATDEDGVCAKNVIVQENDMPILPREADLFPEELFSDTLPDDLVGRRWWVLHTKPRQEKSLARDLLDRRLPFYLPVVMRRWKSRGRLMNSHVPLFPGYAFLLADSQERIQALATHRVVKSLEVVDQALLWRDLRQVQRLLSSGAPVTPEQRLEPGVTVEIQSGPLAGLRGKILKTASGRRFVVAVDFIQQGASVLLDDFVLEKVRDEGGHFSAYPR
jgi:transcription antitermination factor NusG